MQNSVLPLPPVEWRHQIGIAFCLVQDRFLLPFLQLNTRTCFVICLMQNSALSLTRDWRREPQCVLLNAKWCIVYAACRPAGA